MSLEKEIGSIFSHFVNLVRISSVRYDYLFIGDYRNIALKMEIGPAGTGAFFIIQILLEYFIAHFVSSFLLGNNLNRNSSSCWTISWGSFRGLAQIPVPVGPLFHVLLLKVELIAGLILIIPCVILFFAWIWLPATASNSSTVRLAAQAWST